MFVEGNMEIKVFTLINVAKTNEYVTGFEIIALEPGNFSNFKASDKRHWKEKEEDKSLLKITHLMEKAMNLDYLTIYRKSDKDSAKLLENFVHKRKLSAEMRIMISENYANIWQAKYGFTFRIKQFRHNQMAKSGIWVDYAVLKIYDGSETLTLKSDLKQNNID